MATILYRLGRFAFHRRWLVVGVWVVLLGAASIGAQQLSGHTSETFSIPGTESQKAMDLLEKRTGSSADTGTARVVFRGTEVGSASAKQAIESSVADIAKLPHVTAVSDPFATGAVSKDASTAVATVIYDVQAAELTHADQDRLFEAGDRAEAAGLKVDYGGDAAQEKIGQSATEGIGVAVAAVVLILTFGSLLAAGLPLITALVGVGLGTLGVAIASGFTDVGSSTGTLATMLGLAVGIDYALFIVSRYRQELADGREGADAVGRAVGTAGSAVVFAGATVVIALSALAVTGIPNITTMGLAAAGTVLMAVLIALTLLPALLGLMGGRIRGRREDSTESADATAGIEKPGRGERWGRFVVRRRVPLLVVAVAVLGVMAIPATHLRLGMSSAANPGTTQRAAYDAISDGFGPGTNGPLVVVADLTGASDPTTAVPEIRQHLAQVKGVASVTAGQIDKAGDTAIYTVIPTTGPEDQATVDLVHTIRGDASALKSATGASLFVTGATAVAIDVSDQLSSALLPYLVVVVGLALLLLLLVFRSVLVPLKATAGFLLSVFATFGAVVAVFQWGWLADLIGLQTTGPVMSILPIMLVGVLFGLAMDYEVFLVSRMREAYVHGDPSSADRADNAIVQGFRHSSRVVVAAAVIMASVFAGFMFSSETVVKSMGFALSVGVLVDAFVIRMLVGPALMSLLGNRAWALPRWLDRITPSVDVEGESLTRRAEPAGERVLEPV